MYMKMCVCIAAISLFATGGSIYFNYDKVVRLQDSNETLAQKNDDLAAEAHDAKSEARQLGEKYATLSQENSVLVAKATEAEAKVSQLVQGCREYVAVPEGKTEITPAQIAALRAYLEEQGGTANIDTQPRMRPPGDTIEVPDDKLPRRLPADTRVRDELTPSDDGK